MLILGSDGKTPEEQTKQILQIHAILPGQKPERQFNIPSRTNSLNRVPTITSTKNAQSESHHLPTSEEEVTNDLTGLKLDDKLAPSNSLPRDVKTVDAQNQPITPIHKPTSVSTTISEDRKADIAQELPPSKLLHSNPKNETNLNDALRRKDSETQEDDEFHDAES